MTCGSRECGDNAVGAEEVAEHRIDHADQAGTDHRVLHQVDHRTGYLCGHGDSEGCAVEPRPDRCVNPVVHARLDLGVREQCTDQVGGGGVDRRPQCGVREQLRHGGGDDSADRILDRGAGPQRCLRSLGRGCGVAVADGVQREGIGSGDKCVDNTVGCEEVPEFGVDQPRHRITDSLLAQQVGDGGPGPAADRITKRTAAEEVGHVRRDRGAQAGLH